MRPTIALLLTSIPALLGAPNFFLTPSSPEPSVAAQSIAWILRRHFSHSHEAILINPVFNGTLSGLRQGDLLGDVIRLIDARLVVRFYYPRKDFVRPRFMNVFVVDGYGSFRRIYALMHYEKFDSSRFYLVVVAGVVYEDSRELVRKILEDMWALDIVNVNVVVEPVLWLNVSGGVGELEHVDLYPDRMRDFFGCALIGGTHEAKPYTIIPKLMNSAEIVVSGFEGDLVDMLAAKLNFSVRYEISAEAWGFARERGNSTGLMKMIQEEEVDFGVGCMAFAYDRHKYLKPGIAHYTSKVLFAVPSGRPFSAFEKLFRPFSSSIWSLILLYLVAGAIVTCILLCSPRTIRNFIYGYEVDSPYLNMMNIFFGGALERTPSRNFARTLLLLWILFCFVIRTLYQGSLYQYLQRTMNHDPLESMDDIDRSGIRYYMMEIGQRYFVTMPRVLAR
ncbi:uncharacterized protein LOC134288162 [Aedes albopictus]|uniref:Ionotropic glutamate receptor L-glutamate and glycine-binding domain-containing protein n=1 Tax=Aedes albopictus TaxID=7160 RepID=A0ABM1YFC0_AEDAL